MAVEPLTADEAPASSSALPPAAPAQASVPSAAIDMIRESLRSVREKAAEAGLLKSITTEPEPAAAPPAAQTTTLEEAAPDAPGPHPATHEFSVPLGPVPVRLDAFAEWARRLLGENQLFLLDEDGHLLWGVQAKSGLVLSASLAWSAARHSSAAGATTMPDVLHMPLPDGGEVCVVPCETQHGMIQIGVQCAKPISEELARLLREALAAAMGVGEAPSR